MASLVLFIFPALFHFAVPSLGCSLVTKLWVLTFSPKKLCALRKAEKAILLCTAVLPGALMLLFTQNRQYRAVVRASLDLNSKTHTTTF